jgi:uncharacterized protein YdaT
MPWHNGDYPPSYKNQPKKIRDKATEIANEVLKTTGNEGEAIATGLKQARLHLKKERNSPAKNKLSTAQVGRGLYIYNTMAWNGFEYVFNKYATKNF